MISKPKKVRTEDEERKRGYISKFELAAALRQLANDTENRPRNELIKASITFYYTKEEYPQC
jgi:ribbon-helix-helix CopG family protein